MNVVLPIVSLRINTPCVGCRKAEKILIEKFLIEVTEQRKARLMGCPR
jgi:hypothetical protein